MKAHAAVSHQQYQPDAPPPRPQHPPSSTPTVSTPVTHARSTTPRHVTTLDTPLTRGDTRLPRDVSGPLTGNAGAQQLMVFLLSRRDRRTGTIPPTSRAVIARNLGCGVRTVSTAIAVAVAEGVLEAKQRRRRAPYTFRVITDPSSRWENVPTGYHVDVAARLIPRAYLPTWLYIDRALGREGHTADTPAKIAKELDTSERAVRRHVARFVEAGHITVADVKDGRWTLRRPVADPEPGTTATPETLPHGPHNEAAPITMDCNLTSPQIAHLVLPAPEHQAPEDALVSSRRDAHQSDARAVEPPALRPKPNAPRSTSPKPKRRPQRKPVRPDVAAVYATLAPEWRTGYAAARYRPGVQARIRDALDAGLAPEAALRAVTDLADFERIAPGQRLPGLHVPGVVAALHAQAAEIRHGLACPGCGDPTGGHAPSCEHGATLPLTVRLASWQAMGATPDDARAAGDLEAADALTVAAA